MHSINISVLKNSMQCPSVTVTFLLEGLHLFHVIIGHNPVLRSETVVVLGMWVCFSVFYEDLGRVEMPALGSVVKRHSTVNVLGVCIGTGSNQSPRCLEPPFLGGLVKWGGVQEIGEIH